MRAVIQPANRRICSTAAVCQCSSHVSIFFLLFGSFFSLAFFLIHKTHLSRLHIASWGKDKWIDWWRCRKYKISVFDAQFRTSCYDSSTYISFKKQIKIHLERILHNITSCVSIAFLVQCLSDINAASAKSRTRRRWFAFNFFIAFSFASLSSSTGLYTGGYNKNVWAFIGKLNSTNMGGAESGTKLNWQLQTCMVFDRGLIFFQTRRRILLPTPAVRLHRVHPERAGVPQAAPGHHPPHGAQEVQRHHVQQDPGEDIRWAERSKREIIINLLLHYQLLLRRKNPGSILNGC